MELQKRGAQFWRYGWDVGEGKECIFAYHINSSFAALSRDRKIEESEILHFVYILVQFCIVNVRFLGGGQITTLPPPVAPPLSFECTDKYFHFYVQQITRMIPATAVTVHWFRHGLRLHDNPALVHALKPGAHFYPIFIFDGQVAGESFETIFSEARHQLASLYDSSIIVVNGGSQNLWIRRGYFGLRVSKHSELEI